MEEDDLPDFMYYCDMPDEIKRVLEKVGDYTDIWMELHKNKITNQIWAIDAWDKYQFQIALKLINNCRIDEMNITEIRKKLLLNSRGGNDDDECIWQSCKNKRVKDVVFCIDHLYETGARK